MSRIQLLDPNKKGPEADALETRLRQLVIGQDDAINKIVEAYQGFRTGMSPAGRPVGNFLFLDRPAPEKLALSRLPPKRCSTTLVEWSKSIARSTNTATRSQS